MKVSHTPEGIPIVELTMSDLAGAEPAGLTAALDQISAAAIAAAAVASRRVPTIPGLYVDVRPDTALWDLPVYRLGAYGHWHSADGAYVSIETVSRLNLERVVPVRLATEAKDADQ